ncbi:hypothetical protein Y032_0644g1080 [Ancylostoma ceylanicum]|uniref:Uncharacterized protein n=1 Tax=Ancylostoma ceylanicum TaxID=53326 RepID=A0A016WKZ7_9BILA|nr:hypothetical protein Y032_0644g1080 [Ancylostoma ceylanicum]
MCVVCNCTAYPQSGVHAESMKLLDQNGTSVLLFRSKEVEIKSLQEENRREILSELNFVNEWDRCGTSHLSQWELQEHKREYHKR